MKTNQVIPAAAQSAAEPKEDPVGKQRLIARCWDAVIYRDASTGAYALWPAQTGDRSIISTLGLAYSSLRKMANPELIYNPDAAE